MIRKRQEQYYTDFWEREARADATPAVDLNNLTYITIPLDRFPLHFSDDSEITVIEDELVSLSTQRILNLAGMSNTELKETYGAPNLEELIKIDENYQRLSVLIVDYAKSLMEHDMIEEAINVLEFGVETGSDVSTNYTLLADCYVSSGMKDKLPALRQKVTDRHMMLESSALKYIDSL